MKKICDICFSYLLDHPTLKNYKKCPGCGWSVDNDGYNKLNPKPFSKKDCTKCDKCSCQRGKIKDENSKD